MIDLVRLSLRHVLGLNRFETGLRNEVGELLQETFAEVRARLAGDLTMYQRARAQALYVQTERLLVEVYGQVDSLVSNRLDGFAFVEQGYVRQYLGAVVKSAGLEIDTVALSRDNLLAISQFPIQGAHLGEWWEQQAATMSFQVKRNIQLGLLQGETPQQLLARVGDYATGTGTARQARSSVKAIVRTATTAVSAQTQFESLKVQDNRLTSHYQYVATLDDRTTPICISLDGHQFLYTDETAPRPPQHINCRSTIVAVVNWGALGIKPPPEFRASMDGPTSAKTYEDWLRKQPQEVQNDVLGVTKAKLWRDGAVTMKDLLREDGTPISLAELAEQLDVTVEELRA